ncbi:hypothetical protein BDN70DRAFT_853419 [Pholiota conissans]|uniref:Ribosomal protein/NADH dehydrogenase domain-containing protein n=1 Tax=Pholiota conissans TaxID=109636 RepID=A0A9P5Z8Y0_9AGAR|nr:hypothetical protein BDN70DRAFT_853419 [Pholiota conissans]
MPPRSQTFPGGIVRLSKLLSHLNAPPKLVLPGVKSLRLSLSAKGDHFGAQHFVKDQLPRIRYANPNLNIEVLKVPKTPEEKWRPEMEVELENGTVQKLDMDEKWSTSITKELMDLTGSPEWQKHVFSCKNAGLPILPGADVHEIEERKLQAQPKKDTTAGKLPSLAEYLKANPTKNVVKTPTVQRKEKQQDKDKKGSKDTQTTSSTPSESTSPLAS